jgi:putative transposase
MGSSSIVQPGCTAPSLPKPQFKQVSGEGANQAGLGAVGNWAYHNRVQIDFSRPGKPADNAHVESFNGTLRAECLNVHWFETLTEAMQVIESWRREYNESRPHRSLGDAE